MQKYSLEHLLANNKAQSVLFNRSPLMQLVMSIKMQDKNNRQLLLDAIQTFSNYFQKTVLLRHVLTENDEFANVAREHLMEEFCHNDALLADRKNVPPKWDAVLEATSSWFAWKMFTLNDEEKTVLIHLVLETSANIFFNQAHKVMERYGETDYFKLHQELDEKHENMGKEILQGLSEKQYARLHEIQWKGWDMLNAACNRIAELVNVPKNFTTGIKLDLTSKSCVSTASH